MKVNFSTVLRDIRGDKEPIKETPDSPDGKIKGKDFTLAAACCTALLNQYQDEQNLAGTEKAKRYKLATKVVDGGEQDVSSEDITELKKLIAKAFGPLVVGQAFDILDPEAKPPTH